ncbi:hypothetical protein LshimejAT787_0311190 [Lyophyllum shimeji]|uniref:Uncharacterized protein n=1 Tax=Lyophyllum shimeji TaxID=47721 RepID=A0A9P3PIJ8_LYOSH|nr:hypothetical protein LshimejAT787_0311190 [Lyophyllum shimeji]
MTFPTSYYQLSRAVAWLRRSKSSPLDIFLDFRDPSWDWEFPETSHTFRWQDMEAILRLIIPHVKKWKRFELLTDTWAPIFTFLYYTRKVVSAPMLESLSLFRCNAFFASKDATFAPVEMKCPIPLFGGLSLQRLREVSLTGVHVDWARSALCSLTALELMYLASDVMPSLDEFTNMLNACPDLRRLTLIGRGPRIDSLPSGDSSITDQLDLDMPPRTIELSRLAKFTFGFLDTDYAPKVLSLFSFPAIEELVLDGLAELDPMSSQNLDATPVLRQLAGRDLSTNSGFSSPPNLPLSRLRSLKLIGIKAGPSTFSRLFAGLHDLEYLGLYNTQNEALQALAPPPSNALSDTLPCATLKQLECRDMDPEILRDLMLARAEVSPLERVLFRADNVTCDQRRKLTDAGINVMGSSQDLCAV